MTTVKPFTQPSINLKVRKIDLAKGTSLFRVHSKKYKADQYNPSTVGNARFSPIMDSSGAVIPTIYAAESIAAALMETVFHDVSHALQLKTVDSSLKIDPNAHCELLTSRDMKLAVLYGAPMRGLGITEGELIHSTAADYEETRKWAMAIHAQHPDVQGLVWVSRQCSPQKAYIFFGDRCPTPTFTVSKSYPDLHDAHCKSVIDQLLDDMDADLF